MSVKSSQIKVWKKSKKAKNTIGDLSQTATLLGQTSGYMASEQVALMQCIGSLIKDCSGPQDITGDVFHPPQAALPPRMRGARPKIAVNGGSYGDTKKTFRSRVEFAYGKLVTVVTKPMGKRTTADNFELRCAPGQSSWVSNLPVCARRTNAQR